MSVRDDDTELDALASQIHAHPKLSTEAVEALISSARAGVEEANATLMEHSLGAVLTEAVAHRDRGVDLLDLFQEGSLAALVAVEEYVERGGRAAGLTSYVRKVVSLHLDRIIQEHEAAAVEAAELVEDTRLLDVALVALRRHHGREPTPTELAAALQWSPERVELVSGVLAIAREEFDSDIVQYLDDADDGDGDGAGERE
ncbi:MAG: sigma-70 domain-containing protein [Candidatus Dormibacteria bacterium]|jgi:DNA-directed RNA polymerase sigma subunit (sigma70/sigma32)